MGYNNSINSPWRKRFFGTSWSSRRCCRGWGSFSPRSRWWCCCPVRSPGRRLLRCSVGCPGWNTSYCWNGGGFNIIRSGTRTSSATIFARGRIRDRSYCCTVRPDLSGWAGFTCFSVHSDDKRNGSTQIYNDELLASIWTLHIITSLRFDYCLSTILDLPSFRPSQ